LDIKKKNGTPELGIIKDWVCSEYSVMKLAEVMSNKHDVTICGDVITSISFANPNLKYCEYDKLESNSHYDVVIATNYIHYFS